MTPTDDLAAVVRDEAERCGVDVRELARVLLGWTEAETQHADGWITLRRRLEDRVTGISVVTHAPAIASPPSAPCGDE